MGDCNDTVKVKKSTTVIPNSAKVSVDTSSRKKDKDECPLLPGTVFRLFIPEGAVLNILNLLEISSPSGICLIVRIPLLAGNDKNHDFRNGLLSIAEAVKQAGGRVEFIEGK